MVEAGRSLRCQLCGESNLTRFEIPDHIQLWKCEACELYQYGQPAPELAYTSDYHAGYAKNRGKKINTAICRLNRVAKYVAAKKPRLLDIGCSIGATLEAARRRGWDGYGVDISDDALHYCRQRGLNCFRTNGERLPFEDDSFDVVVSWHVIEHVANVRDTLTEWRRVLKPGGVMVVETPDASSPKVRRLGSSYRKFWAPEHTYTFTPDNLRRLAEPLGFEFLPEPWTGSVISLGPLLAPYAVGRRCYETLLKAAGMHKAFQLFARKVEPHAATAKRAA